MNYRNYTMDELSDSLQHETNHNRFIDMAKAFITKFHDGKFFTHQELEAHDEDEIDKAVDEAVEEKRQECRDEMVQYLEAQAGQWIDDKPLERILEVARMLG